MPNPHLTPKERRYIQRLINKVTALDMADPEAGEELRAAEFLADSLQLLAGLRMAWAELLDKEPDGPLH